MKAVFMGLGYIGLPTAAVVASKGIEVVGIDINPEVVDIINQGKIHIIEPDLDKVVKSVVENGMLKASLKPENADAFFIVVPTPFKQNHRADITFLIFPNRHKSLSLPEKPMTIRQIGVQIRYWMSALNIH